MSHKSSSPQYRGPGYIQRLAKHYQSLYRLTWTAALAKAKAEVLMGGDGEGAP